MSLPTVSDIKKLDYAHLAEPYCNIPAKSGIDLNTLDYAHLAEPFLGNDDFPSTWSGYCFGAII